MTDAELIAWIRNGFGNAAADRIEELVATNEELEAKLGHRNLLWQAYDGDLFQAYVDANEARIDAEAKLAKVVEALTPLAAIADAFDANELDDEARKFWGQHSVNTTPHEDIELYQGRGGKQLLTLADCTFARATLAEIKGETK